MRINCWKDIVLPQHKPKNTLLHFCRMSNPRMQCDSSCAPAVHRCRREGNKAFERQTKQTGVYRGQNLNSFAIRQGEGRHIPVSVSLYGGVLAEDQLSCVHSQRRLFLCSSRTGAHTAPFCLEEMGMEKKMGGKKMQIMIHYFRNVKEGTFALFGIPQTVVSEKHPLCSLSLNKGNTVLSLRQVQGWKIFIPPTTHQPHCICGAN